MSYQTPGSETRSDIRSDITSFRQLDREQVRNLFGVIAVLTVFSISFGYVFPALSLNLEARGIPKDQIGLQSAAAGIGVLLAAYLMPWLVRNFAGKHLLIASLLLLAAGYIFYGLEPPIEAIAFGRFVTGIAASILFALSETWINLIAPEALRGRIIGIYSALMAATFAMGPLLIPIVGYQGLTPFLLVCTISVLFSFIAVVQLKGLPIIDMTEESSAISILPVIPLLICIVFAFALFDSSSLTFFILYGKERGLSANIASNLLFFLVIGNVLLQAPLGYLADKYPRRVILRICIIVSCIGAVFLPLINLMSWWAIPYIVIWGASVFGCYTMAMIYIGQSLKGSQLLAANAAFSAVWGIGIIVGGSVTGFMMELYSAHGFEVTQMAIFGALLVISFFVAPIRK